MAGKRAESHRLARSDRTDVAPDDGVIRIAGGDAQAAFDDRSSTVLRPQAEFLLIVYGVTMPPFTFNVSPET